MEENTTGKKNKGKCIWGNCFKETYQMPLRKWHLSKPVGEKYACIFKVYNVCIYICVQVMCIYIFYLIE